ncbi:MAG TPA: hypothetical protein VF916_01945 [Ktedonobacterales bacterium]
MNDGIDDALDEMSGPRAQTSESNPNCYIDQYSHALPHRAEAQLRPCGHHACDPHTITYYGTGEPHDEREGDYCMVCYERTFPGRCPDRVLRAAVQARPL